MPKTTEMTDHDLLIRLDTNVDGLVVDIRDLKDGFGLKLIQLEQRIKAEEVLTERVSPLDCHSLVLKHEQWITNFGSTWKIIIALVSLASIILGIVLSGLNIFRFF